MLLDTSALVAIFTSRRAAARIEREVGDSQVYVSQVQLAEVADWATKHGVPAAERVDAVEQIAHVVPLTKEVCLGAAAIKSKKRKTGTPHFGIVDGIVLATARFLGQDLITFDEDFEGENDCMVLR